MKRFHWGRLVGRKENLPTGLGHAPFEWLRSPPRRAPGKKDRIAYRKAEIYRLQTLFVFWTKCKEIHLTPNF